MLRSDILWLGGDISERDHHTVYGVIGSWEKTCISKTVHHDGGKNPKKIVQNPLNFEIREFLAKIRKSAYLEFFETQFKACINEVGAPTGRISRVESVQDFLIKLDIKPLMHLLEISTV